MAEGTILTQGIEIVIEAVIGDKISGVLGTLKEKNRLKRLQAVYAKSIKAVYALNKTRTLIGQEDKLDIDWNVLDKDVFKKCQNAILGLSEESLSPAQTPEKFLKHCGWILDCGVLYCFEDEECVKQQIAEVYLSAAKRELELSEVYDKMTDEHGVQMDGINKVLSSVQDLESKMDKLVVDKEELLATLNRQRKEESPIYIEQRGNINSISRYCTYFSKIYNKPLFWDKEIPLSSVYIVPKLQTGELATDKVRDFLLQDEHNVLVIEGIPGCGKSSLLSYFANQYKEQNFYFLRLSMAVNSTCENLVNELVNVDETWKNYQTPGNVLFLDGYDEVAGDLSNAVLDSFIWKMKQVGVKVVITSRPGYLRQLEIAEDCKVRLGHYDIEHMEEWINAFYKKKNASQDIIDDRLKQLREIQDRKDILEVLGIPIFLYMVHSRNYILKNIESKTQLYEDLFKQLNDDKHPRNRKDLQTSDLMAMCLGYYMQTKGKVRFSTSEKAGYISLLAFNKCREVVDDEINYDALFGNSFITKISEGEEDREFYHKSIQDYFAAKYIFHKLKEVKCADDYVAILNKQRLNEEIPHLHYFMEKWFGEQQDKDAFKHEKGTLLQTCFQGIIKMGRLTVQEDWYNATRTDKFGELIEVAKCNHIIFENHKLIMFELFQMPITSDHENRNGEVIHLAFSMSVEFKKKLGEGGGKRHQDFWNAMRYSRISNEVIYKYDVFDYELYERKAWISNVHFYDWCIESGKKTELSPRFLECTCENFELREDEFVGLCFERSKVYDSNFTGKWNYSSVENTEFVNTHIKLLTKGLTVTNVQFEKCVFEKCKFIESAFENVIFIDCSFDEVVLDGSLHTRDIQFKNCKFQSTQFMAGFQEENAVSFIDCEFDR